MKLQETEFMALLEKAEALLVGDTENEQVTVLKTARGTLYHCKDNPVKGDFSGTDGLLAQLRAEDDTQVCHMISMWNSGATNCGIGSHYPVDMINPQMRHGLMELNPANTETMILFIGEGHYNARKLGSCLPPK